MSNIGGLLAIILFDPIFAITSTPPTDTTARLTAQGVMNISFADFLIVAVIIEALFFDNWPKQYTQGKNFIIRVVLVVIIGLISFFGYYFLAPVLFIELTTNAFSMIPTNFILWFLWIEFLFAYVWRKWPAFAEF